MHHFLGLTPPSAAEPRTRCLRSGTTYAEFIRSVGLPEQIAQVDPIVASFTGGAVGVLSTLLLVEVNNVKARACLSHPSR